MIAVGGGVFGPLQHVESSACAHRLQIEGANNTLWSVEEFNADVLNAATLLNSTVSNTVREG